MPADLILSQSLQTNLRITLDSTGLSIAQSITAAHKGRIRAVCPAGGRLAVIVTLPQ